MDQASLAFQVTPDAGSAPTAHGLDRIAIEFSANPGQPPRPLAKVASGGELSRVALALMIACGHRQGPHTRIFDEVDAGVGGETAHAVGRFLRQAAGEGQALCVTHLAQVAACADHQLRVIKFSENGTTTTRIEQLDAEARKTEIARMLGSADSTTSLAHAEEMLRKGGIECEV
jgi:DNA repair protein RecN (Recombination protein N)